MKILIVDNYDSFTYNLYQFVGEILKTEQEQGRIDKFAIEVKRNDEISLAQVREMAPDRIIISPGPGSPDDQDYFGVCAQIIREMGERTPLLGVCLGMQGIVHVFGGKIVKASLPMHGKVSLIKHCASGLFAQLPEPLEVMRYHSLVADLASFPDSLEITAIVGEPSLDQFIQERHSTLDPSVEIMAIKHKTLPISGIQFHPESFATEAGKELLANFLLADCC